MHLPKKKQQLVDQFLQQVKEKYPEVELIEITEGAEDPEDVWVKFTAPDDEDREIELMDFLADLETDILLEHGILISIMPTRKVTNTHTGME